MKAKVESLGKIFRVRSPVTITEVNAKKLSDTEFELEVKSYHVMSVKIPCEMYQALVTIAKERNTTLSEVVRTALAEYLQKIGREVSPYAKNTV